MVEKSAELQGEQLDKMFKAADDFIKTNNDPSIKLSNEEKLKFYALFKQATSGECSGPAPSRLNVVAKAKYDAWKAVGKISKDEAKRKFIDTLKAKMPAFSPKL